MGVGLVLSRPVQVRQADGRWRAEDTAETAEDGEEGMSNNIKVRCGSSGLSFGAALAITISWSLHKSILWAILHGIFGWFYVIYYAVTQ